jgi:hypothetical protein
MNGKELAKVLRRLAETIERSSQTQVEDLVTGEALLVISSEAAHGANQDRQERSKKLRPKSVKDVVGLAFRLKQLRSRDDGMLFLANAHLTKNDLEELARHLDLPILREDDVERLKQKIVEASIGARLNSQAITGR